MLFVVGVFQTFRMHSSVCLLCALIILPFDGLSAHVVVCIWVRCFLISSLTPLCMCSVVILPSLSVIRMPWCLCRGVRACRPLLLVDRRLRFLLRLGPLVRCGL